MDIRGIQPAHTALIAPERAQKAARYRFPDDRRRCVAGGLLLREVLGDRPVTEDANGKPQAEGVCFNLSHSGDWAALAVADAEVGCDIELLRMADAMRLGKVVFTEDEMSLLQSSGDRLGDFYRLWTKKEALLKCMGVGFHRAAKTVDVCGDRFCEDGVVYRMKTVVFADYTLSVCLQTEKEFSVELIFREPPEA